MNDVEPDARSIAAIGRARERGDAHCSQDVVRPRDVIDDMISAPRRSPVDDAWKLLGRQQWQRRRRDAPKHLLRIRRQRGHVTRAIRQRWGAALDAYDLAADYALELDVDFHRQHRAEAGGHGDLMIEVLARLHDQTCRVAFEVRALLGAGHAAGAMARWRTMHEAAVTALFIQAHGQDVARRYWRHDAIQKWKWAQAYQTYVGALGVDALDPMLLAEITADHDAAIAVRGAPFREPYGWAAAAFGNHTKPSFADLEQAVAVDPALRWRYQTASGWAHISPRDETFALGRGAPILAERGVAGMAIPGELALNSLVQCTSALAQGCPEEEIWLIRSNALASFVEDAAAAFAAAEREA